MNTCKRQKDTASTLKIAHLQPEAQTITCLNSKMKLEMPTMANPETVFQSKSETGDKVKYTKGV